MLVQFSEQIYTDLSTFAGLTALLDKGANSIRPLMAESKDGKSFVTYYVKYMGEMSKDNAAEYQVIIASWSTDYDKSIAIADQVANAIINSANFYDYLSAEPKFSEQEEIYTEQIFNIKK